MRLSVRFVAVMSLVFAACPPAVTETLEITPATLSLQTGETRSVTAQLKSGTTSSAAAGATWTSSDTAVLTVSSTGDGTAALQGLTAGTATVTAKLREATATLSVTVTVRTATLTRIELSPTNASLAKGTTLQLSVVGFFSDTTTGPVTDATFSSADAAVLTVDAAGLVTGLTAGTSVVTATKGTLTATLSVTVTAATLMAIDVTPALPTLGKGTTLQMVATARFSDTTTQDVTSQATWSSSTAAAVSVDATGLATAVEAGNALISAEVNGVSGGTTITVTAAMLTAIDVTPTAPSIPLGLTSQLTATGRFSDGSTQDLTSQATWDSATAATAIVSNTGLVTSVATGTSVVFATVGTVTGSTTVTVSTAQLVSLSVTPAAPSIARGLTRQFTATGTFSDTTTQDVTTTVTWSSSAATVASISNAAGTKGLVTAQTAGTSTITATSGTITADTLVTVTAAVVTSLQVSPTAPSLPLGLTQQFTATALLSDGSMQDLTTTVTWTTGTAATATISNAAGSEGLLTSVAVGTSTVVATLNTVTASTTVTVSNARLDRIDVTPMAPTVAMGRTLQLTATGVYSDASTQNLTDTVTWTTSPTGKVTVSSAAGSEGLLTTVSVGTTTVTATLGTVSGNQTVIVSAAELVSLAVTPTNPSVAKGLTQQFVAMGTFSDNSTQNLTTQVTWSTGTPAIATVSSAMGSEGLATTLAVGSTTVVATLGTVTNNTTLTVNAASLVSIAITGAPATLPRGRTANLVATGTYTDSSTLPITALVTWSSVPTATATVSNITGTNGQVTGVAVGTVVVTATMGTVTQQVSIDITAAVLESLTITPATLTIAKGRTQQFTVLGTYSDATTATLTTAVTWGSSNGTALGISNATGSNGLATALLVGNGDVTAQLSGVTGTAAFTVTPAVLVSIAVTPVNPSVAKGLTSQFVATGTFSDLTSQDVTTTVTWSSGTVANATISNAPTTEGLATGVLEGTSLISATSGSVVGSTTLTVGAPQLMTITVTPSAPTIGLGSTQQFTATGHYSDTTTQALTTTVTWASSATAAVQISNAAGSEGLANAVAIGTSTVSATSGSVSGSTLVTVSGATLLSIAVTPANGSAPLGLGEQFTAIGTYSDATTDDLTAQVTWSSSDPTVSMISNDPGTEGFALALVEGTTTITATLNSVSGNTGFTVGPPSLLAIIVSGGVPTLPLGRTVQLTATGFYSDATSRPLTMGVNWSSSAPARATVSSSGLVTSLALGAVSITASLDGVTSAPVDIDMVAAVLVSIAVTPVNPTVNVGGPTVPLTAAGTFSDNTVVSPLTGVTWTSLTTAVATVNSSGVVTGVAPGSAQIDATRTGVTGSTTANVVFPIPAVTATVPVNGAVGVRAASSVAFTFSVPMQVASLTAQTTSGACTGSLQLSADNFTTCVGFASAAPTMTGNTATLVPAAALSTLITYKVRVDVSAQSTNSVQLASTFTHANGFTIATDGACAATLVISQVYGAGGNTGATYNADFVELHNPGTTAVSLAGMALQYAAAAGSSWSIAPLPSTAVVPAGGYFLVKLAGGPAGVDFLVTPDHTSTSIGMAASNGKIALTPTSTAFPSGTNCPLAGTLDFVGFGTSNCFEGATATPPPSTTLAVFRANAGCGDSNVNGSDFTTGAALPRNSSTPPRICECTANETNTVAELDFCILQFPSSITTGAGTTTPDIYTRVFEAGLTEAPGAAAQLRTEVGFGPTAVNPATTAGYTWVPTTFNVQVGNDDETRATFIAPPSGSYSYTGRVTRDGTNWTYCDLNGAGSNAGHDFSPAQLGALVVP